MSARAAPCVFAAAAWEPAPPCTPCTARGRRGAQPWLLLLLLVVVVVVVAVWVEGTLRAKEIVWNGGHLFVPLFPSPPIRLLSFFFCMYACVCVLMRVTVHTRAHTHTHTHTLSLSYTLIHVGRKSGKHL